MAAPQRRPTEADQLARFGLLWSQGRASVPRSLASFGTFACLFPAPSDVFSHPTGCLKFISVVTSPSQPAPASSFLDTLWPRFLLSYAKLTYSLYLHIALRVGLHNNELSVSLCSHSLHVLSLRSLSRHW